MRTEAIPASTAKKIKPQPWLPAYCLDKPMGLGISLLFNLPLVYWLPFLPR